MKTLLKNGKVYMDGHLSALDLLIDGPLIAKVAPEIREAADTVIDLQGHVLAPGFVDLHVHLREPGFSHKETMKTGTAAAAAGGFTTVCAMPNLNPTPDSIPHLLMEKAIIDRDALIEVLPYATLTVGEKGESLSDIEGLRPYCIGYSDDGKGVQNPAMMAEAMKRVAEVDGFISAHCEDEALLAPGGSLHRGEAARRFSVAGISSQSEWKMIERDIAMAAQRGVRYHICHISARESVALVRKAKNQGLPITCECTPHQLMLCERDIQEASGRYKMNPPLRSPKDREAIIEGLLDGTIDCIATDHAPHAADEKDKGFASAFGVVGLETAFGVCYTALVKTGRCTLPFLLDKLTSAPAAIIGRRTEIREGATANLTALDIDATWEVVPESFLSMGRSSPFAGMTLQGRVDGTWHLGKKVW